MKLLVSDKIADSAVEALKAQGHDVTVKTGMTPEELVEFIVPFEAIIVRSATKVRKNIIDAASNLKLIVRGGVGLDNIDCDYAKDKGVEVKNTPAASSTSVAELAIAHMMSLSRYIAVADKTMKEGKWNKKQYKGHELSNKTLGVIGCGRIGRAAAKIAGGFSMTVIGYDPYVKECSDPPIEMKSFDDVIEQSDYITLHLPYTEDTKNLISGEQFKRMKNSAYFVSCARGGIVDEKALIDALKNNEIAGAALDVFATEPPERNELFDMDNFEATPHIGAQTFEGQDRVGDEIVKIFKEYV